MRFIGHRWTRLVKELQNTPGAVATLRILAAQGVTDLTQQKDVRPNWSNNTERETRSIEDLIESVHNT